MNELIDLIDKKINYYSKDIAEPPELDLLKKVIEGIKIGNPQEIGLDSFDVLKAIIISYIPNIDLDEAESMTESVKILHKNLLKIKPKKYKQTLYGFLDVIKMINQYNMQDMFDVFNPDSPYYKKPNKYLQLYDDELYNSINDFNRAVFAVNKNNKVAKRPNVNKYKKNLEKNRSRLFLLDELLEYNDILMDGSYIHLLSFSNFLRKTSNYSDFTNFFLVFALMSLTNNFDQYINEINKMNLILNKKINKLNNSLKKKNNERIDIVKRYEKLKSRIINYDKNKVVDLSIIYDIDSNDYELRNAYYLWGLEHNDEIYNSLDIHQNNNIDTLCAKFNFDISSFDKEKKEKIYKLDPNKLEEFLKYCSEKTVAKLLFKSPVLADIIENCDIQIINRFVDLINSNIIHTNLFENYSEMLLKPYLVLNNIEILRDKKLNLLKLTENKMSILLLSSDYLEKNVNMLSNYFNSEQIRDFENFDILSNSKLFDSIDLLIENGLFSDMVNDNSLINVHTKDIINALLLSESIGYDSRGENGIIKSNIVDIDKFKNQLSINSGSLEDYIPNYDKSIINPNYLNIIEKQDNNLINPFILEIPAIRILDENFKENSLTYNICGQIISINKVLRYLTSLNIENASEEEICEMVFNSIIINKIMDNGDVKIIKKKIDEVFNNTSNKVFVR